MKVILAEKPSVAREIAAFVGARSRHEGYLEGGGYQVTWAYGHLVELKEPQDYDPALKRWSLETLPFIPECFGLNLVNDKRSRQQFSVIKRLFRAADEIICATDAGREGELIFRYILAMAGCEKKPFRRLVIQGNRGYGCSAWRDGCKFVLWPMYKDRELAAREIRELLQHGVLQRPIELAGVGQVILSLSDSGAVTDIPVPQKEPHSGSAERRHSDRTRTPARTSQRTGTRAEANADRGRSAGLLTPVDPYTVGDFGLTIGHQAACVAMGY